MDNRNSIDNFTYCNDSKMKKKDRKKDTDQNELFCSKQIDDQY